MSGDWRPEPPEIRDAAELVRQIGIAADLADHLGAAAVRFGAPDRPDLFGMLCGWQDEVKDWQQASEVIASAERTALYAAYRQQVALVLAELTGRSGLAWRKLSPDTGTYLVALDGRELGEVFPGARSCSGGRWRTLTWRARAANWRLPAERDLGPYRSIRQAAEALQTTLAAPP